MSDLRWRASYVYIEDATCMLVVHGMFKLLGWITSRERHLISTNTGIINLLVGALEK